MTNFARGAGRSGAEADIGGEIATYTHWSEDIYFYNTDGSQADISGQTFYMQFRRDPEQTGADVTLSTTGNLSIVASTSGTSCILRISVPSGTFSSYTQDMVTDLVVVDSTGNETLYGHGIVTFTNNPVNV
jgi:hypothetical protein